MQEKNESNHSLHSDGQLILKNLLDSLLAR